MINFNEILKNKNIENVIWVFTSSVVLALSNWLQLSFITKEDNLVILGVFTLSLAVSNPLYQFFNLQLRSLLVTDRVKEFSFSHYYSLRLITTCIVIFLGGIISFFLFNDEWSIQIFITVFLLYGIDAIIDIFNAVLHYEEKLKAVSKSTVLRAILGLTGFLIGLIFFNNLFLGLLVACLLKVIGFFSYDYSLFIKSREKGNLILNGDIVSLFKKAIPLGIGLLIASLNINLTKYFINYAYGIEMQGVFSTLSFIVVLGNITIGAVANVMLPKMAQKFNNNNITSFYKLHYLLLSFTFFIGMILFLISFGFNEVIVKYLFSEQLLEYSYLLNWIFGAAIFTYLTAAVGFSLMALNILKHQVFLSMFSLGINLILNTVFVNKVPIEVLILFSGLVFLLQFVLTLFVIKRQIIKYKMSL